MKRLLAHTLPKTTAFLAVFLLLAEPLLVFAEKAPTRDVPSVTIEEVQPVETTEGETEPTADDSFLGQIEDILEEGVDTVELPEKVVNEKNEPVEVRDEEESVPPWNMTENNKPKVTKDGNSGALVYTYPIVIPRTREKSINFSLSLLYNSQNQYDSYLGYGWDVSLPSIERINKTGSDKLFDPSYFKSSMSGELVQDGSSYFAQTDQGDFMSYSLIGDIWTVTDKNGVTYKFGETAGSRQDDPSNSTHIYKWMISSITSLNGNVINFTYAKEDGQIYPETISYNYNSTTPFTTIVISKELFADGSSTTNVPTRFNTGFPVRTEYLINQIEIRENGSWIRRYDLEYTYGDTDFRPVLQTITETGKDITTSVQNTLPPTTFSYKTFDTYN